MAAAHIFMPLPGRKTAKQRLAMSRGDIGDSLGRTVETMSRTVTKLTADGPIAWRAGIVVELRDPVGRLDIADGGSRSKR